MWLNDEKITTSAIASYRKALLSARPHHLVIDGLFNQAKLDELMATLHQPQHWITQQHTYSELYVDTSQWQNSSDDQRFVQRASWQPSTANQTPNEIALRFLSFLRDEEFMSLLSRIFNVTITDQNVADPGINTNYFRLGHTDFVKQHADDSPGREVCLLLYLNQQWQSGDGGELVFAGTGSSPIQIAPKYNRCILFDPASEGAEHWVDRLNRKSSNGFRYNVTSWYWSE